MKVRWTPKAERHRTEILNYIAADDPGASERMNRLFHKTSVMLSEHPKIGKAGRVPGTRELLAHRSYRLIYEIDGETLWVLALIHTARQWPPK
ncbi:MAG: type II toxin-antitoxin system RelE/ParE family toxin [Burkholderiaceae bacterium]|jgi:addiction module RelE/StbE family toxin|nr:type II toxin-antitoxin system RelE/ParE family toxin [Burkholderiaceae bacterium]